jgi:hypothetical protein
MGPQAGLPLPAEIVGDTAGGRENTVALWRYAGEVTAFAEYYFASLMRREEVGTLFTPTLEPRELHRSRQKKEVGDRVVATLHPESLEETAWPPAIETRRLLQYLLCEQLRCFRLPPDGIERTLTLQVTPIPKRDDSEAMLEVRADTPSIEGCGIKPLLEALATDPLIQQAVFRLGLPMRACSHSGTVKPVTMRVAVRRGRFLLRSVQEADDCSVRFHA